MSKINNFYNLFRLRFQFGINKSQEPDSTLNNFIEFTLPKRRTWMTDAKMRILQKSQDSKRTIQTQTVTMTRRANKQNAAISSSRIVHHRLYIHLSS